MIPKPHISIIAAVAANGVIGRDGDLPWRLSADLKRFKRLTMGHPVVMGRKTWESLRRPLPGRTAIVVTRNKDYRVANPAVLFAGDLDQAVAMAQRAPGGGEIFVIGGGELYRAALPLAARSYITAVHVETSGDARFPEMAANQWQQVSSELHRADEANEYDYSFDVYERVNP